MNRPAGIVIVIGIVLCVCYAYAMGPHPDLYPLLHCEMLGEHAEKTAQRREANIPLTTVLKDIKESDREDDYYGSYYAPFFSHIAVEIYKNAHWGPLEARRQIEIQCVTQNGGRIGLSDQYAP